MVPQFVGLYTLHNNLRTTIFYSIKQHIYELSLPFLKVSILSTPSYEQLTSREKIYLMWTQFQQFYKFVIQFEYNFFEKHCPHNTS